MAVLLQPPFIILLFVLVRSGDLAISAGISRDTIRAICYGIIAILALVVVVLTLFGVH